MKIKKHGKFIKTAVIALLSLVIVVGLLGYFLLYRPFMQIKAKGLVLVASAKQLKQVFSKSDIDLLNNKVNEFSSQYSDFEKQANTVYWATFIPYVSDFKNAVEAGGYMVKATKEAVAAITPYADLIGFKKGATSFVERSAENRLQTAILTLDKMLSRVDTISQDIEEAQIRIDRIDPNRYPAKIGNTVVRANILNIKNQFEGLASLFVDAKPLVKNLPAMFGKDKEKTYLILFQDDKELRATGGFLTAYAIFKIKDGKMTIAKSEDIYSLDNSISNHPPAPPEILTYHLNVNKFYIRDSNLSPDLPTSVKLFNSLYQKSGERYYYDGIITIDSIVLCDMQTSFGDTEGDGVRFSANKDPRCDCAQVLYQLFDMVDRPTPYLRENRKGILGDLMYAFFYKAIGFSPSKYWGTLAQQMFKNLQEKHILLYFVDPNLENAVEKIHFAGRIRQYDGDFLDVVNVNFAGAKSNMFVSESITSLANNDNGTIKRDVTVEYRNPYPHSDCNLERGGLCLNATLRNWVRLYVPKGSKLTSFEGSLKKVNTYDELGKTVFEGYLEVPTQGLAKIHVTYTLPHLNMQGYNLLVEKQPGTDNQKLVVEYNGQSAFNGILDVDKEIKAK